MTDIRWLINLLIGMALAIFYAWLLKGTAVESIGLGFLFWIGMGIGDIARDTHQIAIQKGE